MPRPSPRPPHRLAPLVVALLACGGGDADSGVARGPDAPAAVALGALDTALASPAGAGSAEPNLASDPAGRVYLSWIEPLGGRTHGVRFASAGADGRWTEPRTIAADTNLFVNWADFPSLLPLGGGRLAAHWLQRNGGGRGAYDVRVARSSDDGATWSVPATPHRDGTAAEHGFVSMWPTAEGDSLAMVWLDGRAYAAHGGGHDDPGAGGATQLMHTTVAAGGALADERALDARICDCCQTDVAQTARGPLVVYRDRSDAEVRDIGAMRLQDGAWTQPALVHADGWTIGGCPVNGPAVAARGERAVTAWFTGAGDTARVRVAFSDDAGTTWTAPVRADEGDPVGRVDVALLEDGSAAVLWIERTGGSGAAVRLRRVAPDGALGDPVTVAESAAARASGFPRMASGGEWLWLAWTAPGTPSRVRVARVALERE
jgi:hypothetical protein